MGLLTVTGGLTVATVAFFWAFVKLALAESNATGHALSAYKTFLGVVLAVVFLPPLGGVLHGFMQWIAGVVA